MPLTVVPTVNGTAAVPCVTPPEVNVTVPVGAALPTATGIEKVNVTGNPVVCGFGVAPILSFDNGPGPTVTGVVGAAEA
jgi:hypothetical protein